MRVVHVYKDVYPPVVGGIEKQIDGLRTTMTDVTSDVLVCARGRRSSVERVGTGVEVKVAEFGRLLAVPLAPTFPSWIRRFQADVFHIHMPNPLGEFAAISALGGRPYVASYHTDIVRQARFMPLYRPLLDAFLSRAQAIIVGSAALARTSSRLEAYRDRLELVPYAVDTRRFRPDQVSSEDRAALRRRYGTPLVLSVGRLVYYKGYDQLIAAAGLFEGSLVIAGSGPLELQLRRLARGQPRVHLVGEVPEEDLPALLSAADCFVLPSTSRAESFGVATLEAQAMGVPAVVTDVGTGTVEAIESERSGIVVSPGDPVALAQGVCAILENPDRARAMGRSAVQRVAMRHSQEVQARQLREIYERVTLGFVGTPRRTASSNPSPGAVAEPGSRQGSARLEP